MATTLDELINNPVLLETISVTEFGSVYEQMEQKPFAERTQDDIALAGMLESKKKDLINSSASRLTEMSKEDLVSLRTLIGDAVQISGVEVDLDALKGNIDKCIRKFKSKHY